MADNDIKNTKLNDCGEDATILEASDKKEDDGQCKENTNRNEEETSKSSIMTVKEVASYLRISH